LAGLGKIGRNTLLINDRFGNMIWLSAVLTTLELRPDPPAAYEACIPSCALCSKACPVNALETEFMKQQICYDHAYSNDSGREVISCWTCRKVCPRLLGIK
jgi:epoxyqueuosine reductase QueG